MVRLIALSCIWGWSFVLIRHGGEALTPSTVAAGRTALGWLFLTGVLRVRGIPFPRDRHHLWLFLVVGAFGSAIPFTLLAWGGQHIDSGLSAVLNGSTPLFTAALAVPLLGERARPSVVGGLVIGLLGVAVVAGVGGSDLDGAGLAVLAPVGAGFCYGVGFCWAARHLMNVPTVVAATGQVAGATVLLAPVAAVTSIVDGGVPRASHLAAVVVLGVVGTGLAYTLSYRIIADLGPTAASLVTYQIPVVALVAGWLVYDEPVPLRVVLGGAVIVASVALVTRARRAAPAPTPTAAPEVTP